MQTAAVVNRGVESWGNDGVDDDWTTARLNSVLGTRMTNEIRFQWGRDFEFQSSQDPIAGEPVAATGRTPEVTISGAAGLVFGKPNFLDRRSYPDERRIDIGDTFTISQGAHLIKIGADFSRVSDTLDSLFQEAGAYAYSSRVDFLTDYAAQAAGSGARNYTSFAQGVGPTAFSFHTFDYDAFIQDTWRLNPRTTLNLGLRYDYEQLPDPQIPNPALPATSVFPKDKNNFGPRLGVAYDLSGGRGNSVLRGGYGMFYGRIINSTISNAITNVGSSAGQLALTLQSTSPGAPSFPNVLVQRFGDAGAARRRRVRRQHPESARPRIRRDLRAAPRSDHDGFGLLRRQRRTEPSALHRHQPAGAVGHRHLRRDRWSARRAVGHHADLHRPAAEPRTSGASPRFRTPSNRSTTGSCCS